MYIGVRELRILKASFLDAIKVVLGFKIFTYYLTLY